MATTLTVTRADNELIAVLNCVTVYDRKTENNPVLNDNVDLTPLLKTGGCCNCLILYGINWGGPATFQGQLTISGLVIPFSASFPSSPNGMIWQQAFPLP